jgi:hypothetical protein
MSPRFPPFSRSFSIEIREGVRDGRPLPSLLAELMKRQFGEVDRNFFHRFPFSPQ